MEEDKNEDKIPTMGMCIVQVYERQDPLDGVDLTKPLSKYHQMMYYLKYGHIHEVSGWNPFMKELVEMIEEMEAQEEKDNMN